MGVAEIEELIGSVEKRVAGVVPPRSMIFEAELVTAPLPGSHNAEPAFHAVIRPVAGQISVSVGGDGSEAGIISPGNLAIEAEVQQLATALADQALIAAQEGGTLVLLGGLLSAFGR